MRLLISPRYSEDSQILRNAAARAGWTVERCREWKPEGIGPVDAIHGETLWARVAAEHLGLSLLDPPQDWLTRVDPVLLGRKVWFGKLDDIKPTYPAFIKPPDLKTFHAQVYDEAPWIADDVIVSEPMRILHEVRVWILDGRAVTASVYVEQGRMVDSSEMSLGHAMATAELAARTEGTPRAVVIDVAFILPGIWVVIEANPCYCSGVYQADPLAVLDVVAAACTPASGSAK